MTIVVDIGTTSIRAGLYNEVGQKIHVAKVSYQLLYPSSMAVEMDMSIFDEALTSVVSETITYAKNKGVFIQGIAVTSQRSSVIPVDSEGKAMMNALMWQDRRSYAVCQELESKMPYMYRITGMRLSPVISISKILYLRKEFPQLYRDCHKLIGFCEYAIHALSGVFATDTSIASRTGLFDVQKLQWSRELLQQFELDEDKLCPLVPVGDIVGFANGWVAQLLHDDCVPIISAGGDQQNAASGNGCIKTGDLMANIGTGAYVLGLVDHPVFDEQMRVNCNVSAIPGLWVCEGAVLSAGKTLDWVNETFFQDDNENRPYENFTLASRRSSPGANGLYFNINFAGKGTPEWDPSVKGSIQNLCFSHTKDDIARALLEGIAYSINDCVSIVQEVIASKPASIHVSGGLCSDELQKQILSAVLDREILYACEGEATMLGAWMSAQVALHLVCNIESAYESITKWQTVKRYREANSLVEIYSYNKRKHIK